MASSSDVANLTSAIRSLDMAVKSLCTGLSVKSGATVTRKRTRHSDSLVGMGSADLENSDGIKRTVYVRVVFLKIGEIDTIHEKYAADVFVHGRWREPRLDNKRDVDPDELDWSDYWTANLMLDNALGDIKEETWYTVNFDELGRAMVYEKKRAKGSFLEYLELNQFPFDTQDLTVTVSSDHGEHEVEFVEDDKEICGVNLQSFVDEQEWQLHSTVDTWTKVTTKVFQNAKHKHPALSAACKASRRPGFFIWNVLFVMLFICSLSFAIFAVDIDKIPNRLQLSFILLLTTVTFKFVVTHNLPKISYLTYLDRYILISMLFLCTLTLWHVVAFLLFERYEDDDPTTTSSSVPEDADLIAFCVLISLWVCFQVSFFLFVACMSRYNKRHIAKKQRDHEKKVDRLALAEDKKNNTAATETSPKKKNKLDHSNGWHGKDSKVMPITEQDTDPMDVGIVGGALGD